MSLTKVNTKVAQELKTGIHLVNVYKAGWALKPNSPEKQILSNNEGEKGFEVVFADNEKQTFRNIYWMGGAKQKYFEMMLGHIGINAKGKIKVKEMIDKRIWIAVCEVVNTNGDEILTDITGEEQKDHFIFKTFPFIEGGSKPYIEGDPGVSGVPMYEFRRYKDVGGVANTTPAGKAAKPKAEPLPEKKPDVMQPNTAFTQAVKEEPEEPNFGEDEPEIKRVDPQTLEQKVIMANEDKSSHTTIINNPNVNQVWDEEPNF